MKKKLAAIATGVASLIVPAFANAAFTMPTDAAVDLGPVESLLGVVVVGMLALYGYRKFIKTGNRS